MNNNYGRKYHFNYEFWQEPHKYDFVTLYQVGELHCEDGYEIIDHVQICHEITYIISGQAICYLDDVAYCVSAGDVFITRIGQKHKIVAVGEEGLRYFYIGFTITGGETRQSLESFYTDMNEYIQIEDKNELLPSFMQLLNEICYRQYCFDDLVTSLLHQIVIVTYRKFIHSAGSSIGVKDVPKDAVGSTAYKIIKYIDKNIENLDSIKKLSNDIGYSYNYLSRMFKEKVGITLSEYIHNKKIERSLMLIESGKFSMSRISNMLGYNTVQSFSKAFKRNMKISPSEYKDKLKADL